MDDCDRIASWLEYHHDDTFGFVIYRCAYDDDKAWARFIERLTTHVYAGLDMYEEGGSIKDHFAWVIMENKEELDGATREKVRKLFKQWVRTVGGHPAVTRYVNCIYADQEVIDSVLKDEESDSGDTQDEPLPFVKILDSFFEEQPQQLDADAVPDEELREKLNRGDEGYTAVEGCTREEVGWVKVAAHNLVPRVYSLLMDNGWDQVYVRPPEIMDD